MRSWWALSRVCCPRTPVHFPPRPAPRSYTCPPPPSSRLPGTGCGPKIEIFFGSFFLGFLLDNASNMSANSVYVVFETSPRLESMSRECDPSRRARSALLAPSRITSGAEVTAFHLFSNSSTSRKSKVKEAFTHYYYLVLTLLPSA